MRGSEFGRVKVQSETLTKPVPHRHADTAELILPQGLVQLPGCPEAPRPPLGWLLLVLSKVPAHLSPQQGYPYLCFFSGRASCLFLESTCHHL